MDNSVEKESRNVCKSKSYSCNIVARPVRLLFRRVVDAGCHLNIYMYIYESLPFVGAFIPP